MIIFFGILGGILLGYWIERPTVEEIFPILPGYDD